MDARKMVFKEEGMDIPYELSINNRLRYIRISMDINGMKVSIPSKTNIKDVEEVLSSKRKWVLEHYLKFQAIRAQEAKRNWQSGEKILYRGIEYYIEVSECEGLKASLRFHNDRFYVQVGNRLSGEDRKSAVEEVFRRWYVKKAREAIGERLDFYSNIIGVPYNDVKIKEQKTRWGSCSKKKNLNFNWKLIMAPDEILDYVVVHELCHLKYLNHSKEYWNMVEHYFPGYKEAREWLKENGTRLKI